VSQFIERSVHGFRYQWFPYIERPPPAMYIFEFFQLSHLVSESSQNAEKIQTLASLLSSQSAMEIIDLMEDEEDEEIIWKLILTVIKTQERVGIIKKVNYFVEVKIYNCRI